MVKGTQNRFTQGLIDTPKSLISCRFQISETHVFISIDMVYRTYKTLTRAHTHTHTHTHTHDHTIHTHHQLLVYALLRSRRA